MVHERGASERLVGNFEHVALGIGTFTIALYLRRRFGRANGGNMFIRAFVPGLFGAARGAYPSISGRNIDRRLMILPDTTNTPSPV